MWFLPIALIIFTLIMAIPLEVNLELCKRYGVPK